MPDPNHQPADPFDDYHHLLDLDIRATQLVVCQGMSGSGKTTALQYLYNEHEHEHEQWRLVRRTSFK